MVKFPEECWHCESCVLDCLSEAITLRLPLSYSLMHIDESILHSSKNSSCSKEARS